MTTINPHPKLLRYLSMPPRLPNEEERLIIDLLPRYNPQCESEKPKPRDVPALRSAQFRVPVGPYVSPQDATPVRCNTAESSFVDDSGNEAQLQDIPREQVSNKIVNWIVDQFGA